ncbi:hypothetical protein ACOXXX_13895 [Thalassococcus sp. BH17M4-6]|uniref:hypothetical protein n=1 Tax=Thalassococcus sp. BH17M4-6 TaxID=3413148 RepID=UPI003BD0DF09
MKAGHPALKARRAFAPTGYATLIDVGLDLDMVSPYQIACGNPDGPVLITYNYLDEHTARSNAHLLKTLGYLPDMLFNRVLDRALDAAGMQRTDLYVTHAFHALPPKRSSSVPQKLVEESFDTVTRHEINDRPVIALGKSATRACKRFDIAHASVFHPSARGLTIAEKAQRIAEALKRLAA